MIRYISFISAIIISMLVSMVEYSYAEDVDETVKIEMSNAALLAMDKPISFYGKVSDTDNNPVVGLEVSAQIGHSGGVYGIQVVTDSGGLFEISNVVGNSWLIAELNKRGYEFASSPNQPPRNYENDGSFVASKNNPITFTVRKKEQPTLVLRGGFTLVFNNSAPSYEVDLVKLDGREAGYLDAFSSKGLHIDLRVKAAVSAVDSSCTITIEDLDENSGIVALDELLFVAPASGYQTSYQITIPANSKTPKYLYVKGRSGQIYSRLDATFKTIGGKIAMVVKGWTNPNSGRSIDYDEILYSEYLESKKATTENFSSIIR